MLLGVLAQQDGAGSVEWVAALGSPVVAILVVVVTHWFSRRSRQDDRAELAAAYKRQVDSLRIAEESKRETWRRQLVFEWIEPIVEQVAAADSSAFRLMLEVERRGNALALASPGRDYDRLSPEEIELLVSLGASRGAYALSGLPPIDRVRDAGYDALADRLAPTSPVLFTASGERDVLESIRSQLQKLIPRVEVMGFDRLLEAVTTMESANFGLCMASGVAEGELAETVLEGYFMPVYYEYHSARNDVVGELRRILGESRESAGDAPPGTSAA